MQFIACQTLLIGYIIYLYRIGFRRKETKNGKFSKLGGMNRIVETAALREDPAVPIY